MMGSCVMGKAHHMVAALNHAVLARALFGLRHLLSETTRDQHQQQSQVSHFRAPYSLSCEILIKLVDTCHLVLDAALSGSTDPSLRFHQSLRHTLSRTQPRSGHSHGALDRFVFEVTTTGQ